MSRWDRKIKFPAIGIQITNYVYGNGAMNTYGEPKYYDLSYSWNMRDELAFLKQVFTHKIKNKKPCILEPACGTGRLLVPLIRSGFHCTGFDNNPEMLAYLEQKLVRNKLKADLFRADLATFDAGHEKFHAAFCTVDTFRHLLTDKAAITHLQRVARSLRPGGYYILGFHLLPVSGVSKQVHRWQGSRGRLTVKSEIRVLAVNRRRREETLRYTIRAKKQKFQSRYKLRTYTWQQFRQLLSRADCFDIGAVYDLEYDLSKSIIPDQHTEDAVFLLKRKK